MNKPKFLRHLNDIDIENFSNLIKSSNINWNHEFNSMHNRDRDFKNVLSYPLIDNFKIDDIFLYEKFVNIMSDVVFCCNTVYGPGRFSKIQISKVYPNSKVNPHTDCGFIFLWSHRIHLPIQTNDNVFFNYEDRKINLRKGELVEVNNLKTHHVTNENQNNFERIHLIFDYMPEEYYRIYADLFQ